MALSQVMSTSNQYIKYTIEVITNSQNISNNTSNVTVRVRAYRTNTGYETYGTGTIYCKIDGTTYSAAITSSQKINSSGVILFTRTMDVSHNSDGSKSLTSSAWISHSQFTSNEQSYTTSLTTIPRASSFTATNSGGLDAGSATTITINRASSSFTHNLYLKLGSTQTTIGTGIGTSVTYTIPSTIINQITTSTSGTGVITCDTYNGSTKIGTSTLNFTVKVPTSVVPTFTSITATRVDNGVPSSWGIYVKGYSKCGLAITGASGVSGSTITSYSITGGGYSYTTQSATTGVINSTGTITFTGKITDSRGRTASKTVSITVYDYSAPVISSSSVSRCLSDGTVDLINGTYLKALCNYSYSSVNSKNTCSASVKWKLKTDSSYGSAVALANNVSKVVGGGAIAIISQYDVQITVTDSLRSVTKTFGVQTTAVTVDYRNGGKGVAFGKIVEKDGLEVDWETYFNKTNQMVNGHYAHNCSGISGTDGYVKFATIVFTGTYQTQYIGFNITQRNRFGIYQLQFSGGASTDHSLKGLYRLMGNSSVYTYKSSSTTWDLYIQKSEAYDSISILDLQIGEYANNRISVTWKNEHATSLPSGFTSNTTYDATFGDTTVNSLNAGNIRLTSRDVLINGKRALVGFDTADGNILHINYNGDFGSGTRVSGNLEVSSNIYSAGCDILRYSAPSGTKLQINRSTGTNNRMLLTSYDTNCTDGFARYTDTIYMNCHMTPNADNSFDIGSSSSRMRLIYATNGTIQTSDATDKENIEYISYHESHKIDDAFFISTQEQELERQKHYDFIKGINFAKWDWIDNNIDGLDNLGFIAQDIAGTEVGDRILYVGEDGKYGYSLSNYVTTIAIALQHSIQENNELKTRLEKLEKMLGVGV